MQNTYTAQKTTPKIIMNSILCASRMAAHVIAELHTFQLIVTLLIASGIIQ